MYIQYIYKYTLTSIIIHIISYNVTLPNGSCLSKHHTQRHRAFFILKLERLGVCWLLWSRRTSLWAVATKTTQGDVESAASFPIATPKTHIKWCLGSSQRKKKTTPLRSLLIHPRLSPIAYLWDTGYGYRYHNTDGWERDSYQGIISLYKVEDLKSFLETYI